MILGCAMAMRIAVAFTICELDSAGTYIFLLPYGLILPPLWEAHCSNIYIKPNFWAIRFFIRGTRILLYILVRTPKGSTSARIHAGG